MEICLCRPATDKDVDAIMRIVNQAYLWRQGDSGNGFVRKSTDRYKDRAECYMDIPHTIVGTLDGTVICSGKGLVDKASDSVDIGPLAVDPAVHTKGWGLVKCCSTAWRVWLLTKS